MIFRLTFLTMVISVFCFFANSFQLQNIFLTIILIKDIKISTSMYHSKPLLVKLAMCCLNNDPLSFKKNRDNIIQSIRKSKQLGCIIRIGTELQIPGYLCADHFNEYDTVVHSWEIIAEIIKSGVTNNIVCDIGSPVLHHGNVYNCRIVIYNGKIYGIRAKMNLADGDNYYETRWFGFWRQKKKVAPFKLPRIIQELTGQISVPIGEFLLEFNDSLLAYQICEQAWISDNPMIDSALDGAQIFVNPSSSYVQRGKIERKLQMYKQCTQRHGGCYIYVNAKGAIGQRSYFDGGCIFTENGVVKNLSQINNLDEIIVTPVVANLTNIRTFRLSNKSFLKSTNGVETIPRVKIQINVAICEEKYISNNPQQIKRVSELIDDYIFPHARYEPSLYLWDYLRKSKASGFFLPLSGGLDSCSVALIVYNMCKILYDQIAYRKNETVLKQLRKVVDNSSFEPKSPEQICNKLLFTCYMSTGNSSKETLNRAQQISSTINCHFRNIDFHDIYISFKKVCQQSIGLSLNFKKDGGSWRTDIALQNIQARSRMLLAYLFAQTQLELPKRNGFLLVLGSSNLDQSLRGYYTKYDCSSADFNPIASFSKLRLKEFLKWNYEIHKFQFIDGVLNATPTAELRPLKEGEIAQTDQQDMGLTYAELALFGKLRRIEKLGPVSMFNSIQSSGLISWKPSELAEKIKHFFRCYGKNRHKMTTLTPGFHYDPEGCDDNRLDMRPLMYQTDWEYQFDIIDERVKQLEEKKE